MAASDGNGDDEAWAEFEKQRAGKGVESKEGGNKADEASEGNSLDDQAATFLDIAK